MLGDDALTREFLVYTRMGDSAPQRMRLKLCNPFCPRDLLQQIGRKLVDLSPCTSRPVAGRAPIPSGSHLFAFSEEENCFVPLDGKPVDEVMAFNRLLVHNLNCSPTATPNPFAVASRSASSEQGTGIDSFVSMGTSKGSSIEHCPKNGQNLFSKSPSIRSCRATELEQQMLPLPLRSENANVVNGTGGMQEGRDVASTIELMLQVVGILLSDYAASTTVDVIEPTGENVWRLIEEVLYRNGRSTARSLDLPTVEAFMRTILRSLSAGRQHRAAGSQTLMSTSAILKGGTSGNSKATANGV